jgi:fructose-1,6-bisphosphatase
MMRTAANDDRSEAMPERQPTLTQYIIAEQRRFPEATGEFTGLLNFVRLACKRIGYRVGRGSLGDEAGAEIAPRAPPPGGLVAEADDIFLRTNEYGGHLSAMYSGRDGTVHPIPERYPRGKYLLAFDPLDGADNLDVNAPVGSVFSILRSPGAADAPRAEDFLQSGANQLCAGYAIYGPVTMLVLTLGRGVQGFTLDRAFGEFVLTHPDLKVPAATGEFAVAAANERFWDSPLKRYVSECLAGASGPRGRDFEIRWVASRVADVHRILVRGGLVLCPAVGADDGLAQLSVANPLALLVEQAGGRASTGRARLLDLVPPALPARTPVILGAAEEVERLERYHAEHDQGLDLPFTSPLFNERSLLTSG